MTVREYIGARYVPLFMGDWDSSKTYEPLSIVQYQGNSYTSRQFVPTGIEITDTIYWANTGNYNAQVEAYRQEVLAFDNRIDTLEGKFDSNGKLNTNLAITNSITDGAITFDKLNQDITTIFDTFNTDINTLENKFDENGKLNTNLAITNSIVDGAITFEKLDNKIIRSIEDFGCDSELEDNSTYMQDALDAAAGNYILYIPPKTYNFTNPIVIPWNTQLYGFDRHLSTLYFIDCNGLTVGTDDKGYDTCINVKLQNFHIKGNYAYNHAAQPSTPQCIGLYGWFSNCYIGELNIDHFYRGIETYVPSFQNNDYNYYNNLYGDQRLFNNICVEWCFYGIFMQQYDSFLNNISIAHMGYECIRSVSNHLSNFHIWDSPGAYFQNGTIANNIEIESLKPPYRLDTHNFTSYNPAIEIATYEQNVMLNNIWIWNVDLTDEFTGYNHPYITVNGNNLGGASITNLTIGTQQANNNPTQAPKRLISAANVKFVYIQGIINNKFVTCRDGSFITESTGILYNIMCNSALASLTPDLSTSKKVSTAALS